jgi:hypothetical protein
MNPLSTIARLFASGVSPTAVRMEIYRLGSRHKGEALDGARLELATVGIEPGRARLLRAVVNHLS